MATGGGVQEDEDRPVKLGDFERTRQDLNLQPSVPKSIENRVLGLKNQGARAYRYIEIRSVARKPVSRHRSSRHARCVETWQRVLTFVGIDELIESVTRLLWRGRHPDFMQLLLGRRRLGLGQLVEHVGFCLHPATLLTSCRRIRWDRLFAMLRFSPRYAALHAACNSLLLCVFDCFFDLPSVGVPDYHAI